ncbi:hypothetical protein VTK56DRAFT_3627 [Thermocarpiscus australiensis]
MEKKRKLPARAAARVEQAAKRRNTTPPQRSATPASAPESEPTPVEDAPPPLPKSVSAGKPLPTVDSPQPDDLPNSEYQSVTESGVLAESLLRSRQKWISEGIFEKYWTKPTKRKGVVIEEPNNPPKESMTKLGQVTITVEPHVFEATMYAVKDPKPPPPPPPSSERRPTIQYGPPNGVMPPPSTPSSVPPTGASTPTPAPSQQQPQEAPQPQTMPPTPIQATTPTHTPTLPAAQAVLGQPARDVPRATPTFPPPVTRPPVSSPRGMESVLSPAPVTPLVPPSPSGLVQTQHLPPAAPSPSASVLAGISVASTAAPPRPSGTVTAPSHTPASNSPAPPPAGTPGKPVPGTDPIILTLAEKAGVDPQLRDLMKRVAQGEAAKHELERFQAIIDAITAESKRKGSTAGPSADRLLVDGRTVRYFADEVRAILDIVLSSNPKQTSADLRPPAGSDPLVVLLVKAALDDLRTRDMVRRIAENKPQFSDATDLKGILDRLRTKLVRDKDPQQTQSPVPAASPVPPKSNGAPAPNGHAAAAPPAAQQPAPQQALRSKGPPPPPKPDISAIVFEFAGGTGDRYLFPKFSLLEYVPVPSGQQVVASFLLVRKGSKAEYPMADPELDYYQPLTIRLFTHSGRHLEHLARVVAPPEEVRRYMDDVMTRMTRAEYVLLAMRLPRGDGTESASGSDEKEKDKLRDKDKEKEKEREKEREKEPQTNGVSAKKSTVENPAQNPAQPGVLWTARMPKPQLRDLPPRSKGYSRAMDPDEQYQSFIASVSRKEGEV